MKNKLPLILTIVFAIASIAVAYRLYQKVMTESELQQNIITQEEDIKTKLTFYAQIQKLHYKSNKKYIGTWKEFKNYVSTGQIIVTQRSEKTEELYFGKDTTIITIDTIKIISIKDSILSKTDYDINTLEFVPDDTKPRSFDLYIGKAENRATFEIRDSSPINPKRTTGEMDTLMVGSKFEPTTEGNWH